MLCGRASSLMKLGILSLGIFCLEASARATASKVGLTLFSEPEFKGSRCEIQDVDLKTEACFDIPASVKAKSIKLNGSKCCVLYRSPCPKEPFGDWPQVPMFLNQRVFANVDDLESLGFSSIVRSVVCPNNDVCSGIEVDRENYGPDHWSMRGYWIDARMLPQEE